MAESTLRELVEIFERGSRLDLGAAQYGSPGMRPGSSPDAASVYVRETFARACLTTLFNVCGLAGKDQTFPLALGRMAGPALLRRCDDVLRRYVRDKSVSGLCPLPRVRNDEVLLVLQQLLDVEMSRGIFPSREWPHGTASALTEGEKAHLFHLYPTLCYCIASGDPTVVGFIQKILMKVGAAMGVIQQHVEDPVGSVADVATQFSRSSIR